MNIVISAKNIIFGSEFTARKVDNMYQLFKGCLSLKSADLSRFHPKVLIETAEMFYIQNFLLEFGG